MSKVHVITANAAGQLVNQSSNPEFGYIRVEEKVGTTTISNGWARSTKRSALIKGNYEALVTLVQNNNLRPGSELPMEGKIVIRETTVKAYEGQTPKQAGTDGEILKFNGAPIYRETVFTSNLDEVDVLITHDAIIGSTATTRQSGLMHPNPNVG